MHYVCTRGVPHVSGESIAGRYVSDLEGPARAARGHELVQVRQEVDKATVAGVLWRRTHEALEHPIIKGGL